MRAHDGDAGNGSPAGIYERTIRPAVFRLGRGDAEHAHDATLRLLSGVGRFPGARAGLAAFLARHRQPTTVAGISFPGTVGLAAGMDKNGTAARMWASLGFGFAELGTVTPQPQPGNPAPRLFRLPASEAFINRMGFNNDGVGALAARLRPEHPHGGPGIPIGVSIGKNKHTPNAEARADYLYAIARLCGRADYIAVNVSSPNTPGLRSLQDRQALTDLLATLVEAARAADGAHRPVPIFVKISPDLSEDALEELLDVCHRCGVDGLIAVNTTTGRGSLAYDDLAMASQMGGLSGRPLARRAREVVGFLTARSDLPVIGVGGITTVGDAQALVDAGATLLQVFTGFVYHGPALIRRINRLSGQRHRPAADPERGAQRPGRRANTHRKESRGR